MATERDAVLVELWTFGPDLLPAGADLSGYSVEASDGGIGKIDETTGDAGASYVVVDTGPWIFGKKVMLPAGTIARVDHDNQVVHVTRTKDEIKNAPELDTSAYDDYRRRLGDYYASFEAPGERPGVGVDRTVRQG
jgi:hypothetical protein